MSKSKKTTILLAVLLLLLGVVAFMDKEISTFEYVCLYVNAVLYLGLVYHGESLIETLTEFTDMQDEFIRFLRRKNDKYMKLAISDAALIDAQKAEIETLNAMVELLEKNNEKHDSGAAD